MSIKELEELIDELNNNIPIEVYNLGICWSFTSSGFVSFINLGPLQVWCSEHDDREYIDSINEYEPIKKYLKRQANNTISLLKKAIDNIK